MYNAKAVITGIVIFVIVFSSPFWLGWLGLDYTKTGVVLPAGETACIADTEFMRANHMRLLDEWRDKALREENREYISALNGKRWLISLQNTCMECHNNYAQFCERCHVANSVYPYCWSCHIIPAEAR